MINLNRLKFGKRKKIHYTLIGIIIVLQLLIALSWYYETYSEAKLLEINQKINTSNDLIEYTNFSYTHFNEAQNQLQKYLNTRETVYLDNYYKSFDLMGKYIDSIKNNPNHDFKKILESQYEIQASANTIKSNIDSLLSKHIAKTNVNSNSFVLKKFEYEDVLNSIDIETSTKVDSVKKKGFFGRIGGAISGKTEIQKEKKDVMIKMKYGKNVSTGNIQDQIEKIFENMTRYYQNEFLKFKVNFENLKKKDLQLLETNRKLVTLSESLLGGLGASVKEFRESNQEQFDNQSKISKKVKIFSTILLLVVMSIATIILILFTKLAFDYEKNLLKAKDQIAQSLNFKSRIIGMISHEIRSPLSIISMISRRVATKIEDKEIQEQFKSIDFTTNSLLQLSNQVLEYSKNEKVKPKLNIKSFEIKHELNQIVNSLKTLVENKGNRLDFLNNINEDIVVESDLVKIHQLFYNIIGNANKFTNDGTIKITIGLAEENSNNFNLTTVISDTGMGIEQNDIDSIFESYYQGVHLENVSDIGAGLGLNLCKEIVDLFGGNIAIESQKNIGTKVMFNLILNKVS